MTHKPTILLTEELRAIKKHNKLSAEKIAQITKKRKISTIDDWLSGEPVIPIKALRLLRKYHKQQGGIPMRRLWLRRGKAWLHNAPVPPLKESTNMLSDIAAISTRHLSEAHVDWLLKTIRPLLISQFVHGYKHGRQEGNGER